MVGLAGDLPHSGKDFKQIILVNLLYFVAFVINSLFLNKIKKELSESEEIKARKQYCFGIFTMFVIFFFQAIDSIFYKPSKKHINKFDKLLTNWNAKTSIFVLIYGIFSYYNAKWAKL